MIKLGKSYQFFDRGDDCQAAPFGTGLRQIIIHIARCALIRRRSLQGHIWGQGTIMPQQDCSEEMIADCS